MRKKFYFITNLVIFSVLIISQAIAEDNPQKKNDPKQAQKQAVANIQKNKVLERKIDGLIGQQKQEQKLIQNLDNAFHQHVSLQKKNQADTTHQLKALKQDTKQQFKNLQQKLEDQWGQLADHTKKNQDLFQGEISKINDQLQTLQTDMFSSLSSATQHVDISIQSYKKDLEIQISEIRLHIQEVQTALMTDQSRRYSSIELSREHMNAKIDRFVETLSQLKNQLSQEQPDLQQIINDQISAQQERLSTIETNIKSLIANSNAQLNSDINETIRQLKNDFIRFKQEIDDSMDKVSSQVLEIKHEQQIELQSLVKQLTKELNRHDQNISESLNKVEKTLDTTHLNWIIYGLLFLIIGLIIYIVWDRNTTVAPLIARIRKLEDNLVIEY